MNANDKKSSFWKRLALGVTAGIFAMTLMGCSVDDVFAPFQFSDIPFDQEQTAPTDMGAVDNPLTVPVDRFSDNDRDIV